MKLALLAACATGAVLLVGCGSKNLTRSKAKELIAEYLKNAPPQKDALQIWKDPVGNASSLEQALADQSEWGRMRKHLIDDGVLTAKWLGGGKPAYIELSLTPTGSTYKLSDMYDHYVVVKLCEMQVKEVTGISVMQRTSFAKAQYTWEYGNMTPFGKWRREIYGNPQCDPGPHESSAVFQLFDDGWRIAR